MTLGMGAFLDDTRVAQRSYEERHLFVKYGVELKAHEVVVGNDFVFDGVGCQALLHRKFRHESPVRGMVSLNLIAHPGTCWGSLRETHGQQGIDAERPVGELADLPYAVTNFFGIKRGNTKHPHATRLGDRGHQFRRRRIVPAAHAGEKDRVFDTKLVAESVVQDRLSSRPLRILSPVLPQCSVAIACQIVATFSNVSSIFLLDFG